MRSAENIKRLIKNLHDTTSAQMDERVLRDVLDALAESEKTLALKRRTIMKSPIVKLAAAAAIIAVVVLGIFEYIGTDSKSGVVWAEVAKKVESSRGVIYRSRGTPLDPQDGGPGHTMNYLSNTHARFDSYKADQIIKTIYNDFNTKTVVLVHYGHKSYIKKTLERMEHNDLWRDPKSLVQRFLSHEHRELGRKTVEGVLCEGLETTDTAFAGANFPVDSFMARIWVSVETGYPVLLEVEVTRSIGDNEKVHIKVVADQFQWDVELDPSFFEPKIPADYMEIEMP